MVAIGGVVFAWARLARTLPDLHGWHLSAPASEFRASQADGAYTFDDYLAQENRVFAELDDLMKKDWAGESVGRFCRYKPDSICNPATLLDRNWNRTVVLESAKPAGGALLVHGLSDAPYSLRTLAGKLHESGYTVIVLRVPGHGTCPKALAGASWQDWAAAVRVAMQGLRKRVTDGKPLVMVGYSNGGTLCVDYAARVTLEGDGSALPKPSALALISPMIAITPMAEFTRLYPLASLLSGEKKLSWSGIEPEIDPFKYSSWPTNASMQASLITGHVGAELQQLAAENRMGAFPPVLVVQSVADSTVVASGMIDTLMDRVAPGRGRLILFDINRYSWLEGLTSTGFEQIIRPRLARGDLPFALTVVTNRSPQSREVLAREHRAGAKTVSDMTETEIGASWPIGTFSLSHVALPIPPSDPVYGADEPGSPAVLPLGTLALRGERDVLAISPGLMMRMRHNPFYDWTERQILSWISLQTGGGVAERAGPRG